MLAHDNILQFTPRTIQPMPAATPKPARGGKRAPLPRLTITIPNFQRYQSAAKGKRDWAKVHSGIGRDAKMVEACRYNLTPGFVFTVLLTLANNSGVVDGVTAKDLSLEMCGTDPRTIMAALERLAVAGLIVQEANASQTEVMQKSNRSQTEPMQTLHEEVSNDAVLTPPRVEKEIEKEKETKAKKTRLRVEALPSAFQTFWREYTDPTELRETWEVWQELMAEAADQDALVAEIMTGLAHWKTSQRWADGYIKSPFRWLRDGKWRERPPQVKSQAQSAAHQEIDEAMAIWKEAGVDW